ncbi:MAG: type VI-B CRISPR-associated RNA-guided ribonuclease Cas13b [Planctomycetaceae bacterium]|nr:type VI-B CRISPR-associated RNA-guided ribonuclease Cas13b [Planctomycetaceae bacterium]
MKIATSQKKSFWAMHLNSACNNFETVVNHLIDKFTIKKGNQEEAKKKKISVEFLGLVEYLRDKNFSEQNKQHYDAKKQRLVRELLKRLPFLNAIRETVEQTVREAKDNTGKNLSYWDIEQQQLTPEDYAKILEYYSKLLTELRNYYTHVDHDEVSFHKPIESENPARITVLAKRYQLNILHALTAALRETKNRFNYPSPQENNKVDELLHLRRYNGVENATKQDYDSFRERIKNGTSNILEMPVFKSEIQGKVNYSKMKDNPNCRFFENKNDEYVFTERGFTFFLCWFLQLDEIDKVFQKIKPTDFEKNRRTKEFIAAKRTFGVFHINLPKTRIESVEKMLPDTLGMDIIAELHKIPSVVWNYLDRADQKRFRTFINKLPKDDSTSQIDNSTINEDEDGDVKDTDYSGRRSKNRFNYLALSYLDMSEAFDKIRFRIDWGNYVFEHYEKEMLDGSINTNRRLQKRIYSYERIQDAYKWFNENRSNIALSPPYYETDSECESTKELSTDSESKLPKQFRVPMIPQYAVNTKKKHIGITFREVKQPNFTGKTTRRLKPDALLNLVDLPVLVFLSVHGRGGQAQNIIHDYYTNYRKLLQDLKDGKSITPNDLTKYEIPLRNLPFEIGHYIETGKLSAPKENKLMQTKLQKILEQTEKVKKKFEDEAKRNFKAGDKRKPYWKAGTIGDYLAHDLVKLQRPNKDKPHQGKITGANFGVLQAALATYTPNDNGTIREIFAKAGLIDNLKYPHPFLNELVDEHGIKVITLQAFFRSYLVKKIEYIKKCKTNAELTYLLDSPQRQAERKQKDGYIASLAEHYLNEPLLLPKFFFDSIVQALVEKECQDKYKFKEKETQKKGRGMNTPFLILRFHQWKYGDASQWFYTLPHGVNSESLKKITNILKLKISRKDGKNKNFVGLNDQDQQALYDRWTKITESECKQKKPLLIPELNAIRKEFNKYWKCPVKVFGEVKHSDYRGKFALRVNHIEKQEQLMRFVKLQDIVLFHAACKLLQLQAKLSDIQENKQYLLGQNERQLEREYKIPATSACKRKTLSITITGKMKIKDVGNFNRITNDPRTPSILRLYLSAASQKCVDYEKIREELAAFDCKRKDMFQWVHDFENQIKLKYPAECQAKRKNGYVDFWGYCEVLIGKKKISIGQALALSQIRNGFSHNYLPEFEYADKKDLKPDQNTKAHKVFDELRQKLIGVPLRDDEFMTDRCFAILNEIRLNFDT